MENILECAKLYEKLLDKDYVFTVENDIRFTIHFTADNFYHLLGLEKLTDVVQLKNNQPAKVYKQILSETIESGTIQKSNLYYLIENRIRYFEHITDFLNYDKSNKIIIDFNTKKLSFKTKLHNTKFILYKHIDTTYLHLTIGNKRILYPETFIVEYGGQYISGQKMLDILGIDVIER